MTVIESLRNYFAACPLLKEGKLSVDYLGQEPTGYTIDVMPSSGILKRYADGGSLREFLFVFGSREYYGKTVLQNLENSGFYERFAAWLEDRDRHGDYPEIGEGRTVQEMSVTSTGYLFDATENNARYQIQCRLLYYQD